MQRSDFRFLERLRVRWAEIDAQQIVFNGHYLMYFDTAIAGYWRALAMPYHETMEALAGDMFVRKATLEYFGSAVYDDVPLPAARVVDPDAIVRKLRIGLGRVERHTHHLHRMVADAETVMTEHTEDWHFAADHVVALPFVSVQVIEDGRIALWRDYSNIDTLLSAAPQWWLEHVTTSWAEG